MTSERTVPAEVAPRTGDLALVQALHETRAAARRHVDAAGDAGDDRWQSIADRADRVLAVLGIHAPEAGHTPAIGFDRIDRTAIDLEGDHADRVAALRALHDRPDAVRIDAADDVLADLEDALG